MRAAKPPPAPAAPPSADAPLSSSANTTSGSSPLFTLHSRLEPNQRRRSNACTSSVDSSAGLRLLRPSPKMKQCFRRSSPSPMSISRFPVAILKLQRVMKRIMALRWRCSTSPSRPRHSGTVSISTWELSFTLMMVREPVVLSPAPKFMSTRRISPPFPSLLNSLEKLRSWALRTPSTICLASLNLADGMVCVWCVLLLTDALRVLSVSLVASPGT
mmetsp:Transcript_16099/g.34939  ORF Transcript_16099/g.34939 Transcript_16099/m.34939 type:complete len:216 (-) Transcript_16099:91-738(-)